METPHAAVAVDGGNAVGAVTEVKIQKLESTSLRDAVGVGR